MASQRMVTQSQQRTCWMTVAGQRVRRVVARGAVPVENWGELFRCFVGPAARMNLKTLQLGVQFELEFPEAGVDPNDPAVKAMEEAARQLGLSLDTSGGKDE